MPDSFTSAHLLYVFSGKLPGGEEWSCGLRTVEATPALANLQSLAQAADAVWVTFWNTATYGPSKVNPPSVSYEGVTVRAVSTAGLTTGQADYYPTTHPGAAATQTAPQQSALVVTLLTARAGRTGKGRIYLPFLTPTYEAYTGRITSQQQTGIAAQAASMVYQLGQITSTGGAAGPFAIAVQSRTNGLPGAPVTSVRVGDVIDTQRRRRDKLVENYASHVVAAA